MAISSSITNEMNQLNETSMHGVAGLRTRDRLMEGAV